MTVLEATPMEIPGAATGGASAGDDRADTAARDRVRAKPSVRFAVLAGLTLLPTLALLVEARLRAPLLALDGLLLLAFLVAWFTRVPVRRIGVTRELARVQVVRSESEVRLWLENGCDRPVRVTLHDEVPPELALVAAPEPLWLAPGERRAAVYRVRALRRGTPHFGDLWLRCTDRVGLVDVDRRVPLEEAVRIHPAPLPASGQALILGRATALGPGAGRARHTSEGALFEGLRSYVEGDDPRLIEWKATARRGRPVVREMRPERNQRIVLMIDQGRALASALGEETKLDRAVEAAHQLATLGLGAGDEVGLVGFGAVPRAVVAPARGAGQGRKILDALIGLEAEPVEANHGLAFAQLGRLLRRRALVVLFTDIMDPDSSSDLIAHLRSLVPRHLPLCVTVEDSSLAAVARGHDAAADVDAVYRKIAARELVEDQQRALETLKRSGVLSVHVPARALAAATLDRYLELKYRGQL